MSFEFDEDGFKPKLIAKIEDSVNPTDLPEEVYNQIVQCGNIETTESGEADDSIVTDAMIEIVTKTCTAQFHKRKGYVDSSEESAITFHELLKLFEVKLQNCPTRVRDIFIELEDCFIYVHSGSLEDKVMFNPENFKLSTKDPVVLYIFTEEVSETLQKKREYREKCETMFNRLKNREKPVLVFNWVDSIFRGEYSFSAPVILRKLGEDGFEQILQFHGVYTYSHTKKSGEIVLRQRRGIKGKQYDVVHLKTTQDFIDYWTWIFKYWLTMCQIPSCDPFSKYIYATGNKLRLPDELMPAPYIGNPLHCSAVILNYNPGAANYNLSNLQGLLELAKDPQHHNQRFDADKICGHMAHNYWQVMKNGEYFNIDNEEYPEHRSGQNDGPKWWEKRKQWIDKLVPNTNLNPFGLEICGWHSNSWGGVSYNKDLLKSLKNRLAGVIEESINKSALGIGICVGSQYGVILPAFGYEDVTNDVLIPKITEKYRKYRVFRNQNETYIINTWLTKGYNMMNVPSSHEYEECLISAINNMKGNNL